MVLIELTTNYVCNHNPQALGALAFFSFSLR